MCRLSWNLGASTSWNMKGLSRPVMGLLYIFISLLPQMFTKVKWYGLVTALPVYYTGEVMREQVLLKRSAIFWDVTHGRMAVSYRRFRTTYLSHIQRIKQSLWIAWPLKMGQIICPETSVRNCHSTVRNVPEDWRSLFTTRWKPQITQVLRSVVLFYKGKSKIL
jgi:hypothetical protein